MGSFWKKRSEYEKIVIMLVLGFALFCISHFLIGITGAQCPLCQKKFSPGESYLWDSRSGDIFPISPYVMPHSDFMWRDGMYDVPQERSTIYQCGFARFPDEVFGTPNYCPAHRALFDKSESFLILSVDDECSVCYVVSDEGALTPEGHFVMKRRNDDWNCWELVIGW